MATVATRTRPSAKRRPPAKKRKAPARRPKAKQPGLTARAIDVLIRALRAHVGYSLKALGGLVMGDEQEPSGDDLLDIVRNLVQRRESTGSAGPTPPLQVVRDIFRDKRGAG